MEDPEQILEINGIKWSEIEKVEDGADQSRRNFIAKSGSGNYHISFQKDRETPVKRKTVEQKINSEVYSYRRIGEETSIRTPEIIDYSDRYILTREIQGKPTISYFRESDQKKQERIARKLGGAMAEIHGIKTEKIGYFGVSEVEKCFSSWFDLIQPRIDDVAEAARSTVERNASDYLKKNKTLMKKSISPVLVYGDFQPWNTLSSEDRALGLIDGELAFSGHREFDLAQAAVAWSDKFNVNRSFIEGYRNRRELDEEWRERHGYYKTYLFTSSIISARAIGWDTLVQEFRRRLKKHLNSVS